MDQKALQAEIFGEDSDDDDEYVPPTHVEEGGDDDDRAAAILESAKNNLLLVGKKEKKKAEKKEKKSKDKDIGRGAKRRSKPSADEMAAEGRAEGGRKRLKKGSEAADGEAGGSGAGGGEGDGEEGADGGAGGPGDPDEDSVDGEEAIEAGGKGDIQGILDKMKGRRGQKTWKREELLQGVEELQQRMEAAVEEDDKRVQESQPAVVKVSMLPEVEAMMRKKQYHEVMMDKGMLSTLGRWLKPMSDGTLVSVMIRKALLTALLRFEIDETALGMLRSSGLGKYVKLFTLHKKETQENRKLALALIEKWSRPIFQTSDKVRAEELPVAYRPLSYGELPKERPEDAVAIPGGIGDRQTGSGTRVPRAMGMDFHMLPADSAQPLPSTKYAKDSSKGRLQDRIVNGKKKASAQAVTLSVEGRTLDRI